LCCRYIQVEETGEQVEEIGIRICVKSYETRQATLSARASVSRAVKRMEKRGLIIRTRRQAKLARSAAFRFGVES
jgi:DNA-binding MarR family transcriptional regulator